MALLIVVGILEIYDPTELDGEEDGGFIWDYKEQFDFINRLLVSKGLPPHYEPEQPLEGEWELRSSWRSISQLIRFVTHPEVRRLTTCKFEHLRHLEPDQFIIPVDFNKVLRTGTISYDFDSRINNILARVGLLKFRRKRMVFKYLPSSIQLKAECKEAARLFGLEPDDFPLMMNEDDTHVLEEWENKFKQAEVHEDLFSVAMIAINLYQAATLSIIKNSAIYLG